MYTVYVDKTTSVELSINLIVPPLLTSMFISNSSATVCGVPVKTLSNKRVPVDSNLQLTLLTKYKLKLLFCVSVLELCGCIVYTLLK